MKMIGNKVLVRMRERRGVSPNGIIIPERAQKTETWGEVISAGAACEELAVGDLVHVGELQGTHFGINGQDHIIVTEDKIVCKLTDVPPPVDYEQAI